MKNPISLFFAAVIFVFIPVFAARPMTSLFAEELNASMYEIGLITACYSITPLVMAIFAGRYIDRYGERIPLFIGSLGILISLSLPFIFPVIPSLYLSQILLGASQLLAILSIQNGVNKSASNQNRDRAVGTFSFFSSIGMLLGPVFGGYATEHFGFRQSFLLLALVPLVSLFISLFVPTSKRTMNQSKQKFTIGFKELLLIPSLSRTILVSMVILSALDIFYVYFPLFAQSLGFRPSQIGWLLAAQSLGNTLSRFFMPKLVEHYGRITILWVFMGIGALAYGSIPFMQQFVLLFCTALILGAGLGVTQPLTIILAFNASPHGMTGEVLGIRLASNRLAQTIIPFFFASLSNVIGLGPIFFLKAFLLIIGALTAKRMTDPSEKQKSENKKLDLSERNITEKPHL
ncbi:MFS transporter [Neobacillus drentensis]|uniref:MFS transporter n=1 Tax=Neobacillus drentensis TaxID=220684 RepID=UPI000825E76D|nr:MFS transporter [Neobacillus drentensis]